jgi:PTH2 family peptidyl-tRNA hydrolase
MVKQVIVMRKDLSMNKGKMIAQGAHASVQVLLDYFHMSPLLGTHQVPIPHWAALTAWLRGTYTKVCVGVSSEDELLDLFYKAKEADLPCALITDSGKTVFNGEPTNTCIAIGPADAELIDEITGKLKLL